jgi:RNA polymerase sigma factor (sigma-70 family)
MEPALIPADATTPTSAASGRARFERLLAEHRGIVLKIAASYARGTDERADLAQEIALQLWRAWPRYSPERAFSTWMYRIALNVAISSFRSRPPMHEGLDDSVHGDLVGRDDVDAESAQRMALVQRAMQALAAPDRALLLLHLEGRNHREAGEILGLTETNAATRLSRIRKQLRQLTGAGDQGSHE